MDIEEQVLRVIDERRVERVDKILTTMSDRFSDDDLLDAIKKLEWEGKVEISPLLPRNLGFLRYLLTPLHNLWLYAIFVFMIGSWVVAYIIPAIYPWSLLKWAVSLFLMLFLPGHVMVTALYPRRGSLARFERLAISVGLSMAITPLIGLGLNYTPWGIRLDPLMIALSIFILGLSPIASWRKFKVSLETEHLMGNLEEMHQEV